MGNGLQEFEEAGEGVVFGVSGDIDRPGLDK